MKDSCAVDVDRAAQTPKLKGGHVNEEIQPAWVMKVVIIR